MSVPSWRGPSTFPASDVLRNLVGHANALPARVNRRDSREAFVAKIVRDVHYWHSIFGVKDLEIRDARILTEIDLRGLEPQLSGDIDILVLPHNHVERATAIQVKRFKIGRKAVRTGRPNGLGEFLKGVRQSNDLAKLGSVARLPRSESKGGRASSSGGRMTAKSTRRK